MSGRPLSSTAARELGVERVHVRDHRRGAAVGGPSEEVVPVVGAEDEAGRRRAGSSAPTSATASGRNDVTTRPGGPRVELGEDVGHVARLLQLDVERDAAGGEPHQVGQAGQAVAAIARGAGRGRARSGRRAYGGRRSRSCRRPSRSRRRTPPSSCRGGGGSPRGGRRSVARRAGQSREHPFDARRAPSRRPARAGPRSCARAPRRRRWRPTRGRAPYTTCAQMSGPSGWTRSSSPGSAVGRREHGSPSASRSGGRDACGRRRGAPGATSASAALDRRRAARLPAAPRGRRRRVGAAERCERQPRPRGRRSSRHVVSFPPATDTIPPPAAADDRLAPRADGARTACREDAQACEPRAHERGREHVGRQRPPRLGQDLGDVRVGGRDGRRVAVVGLVGGAEQEHPLPRDRERHAAAGKRRRHRRRPLHRRPRGRGARPSTERRSSRRPGPRAGGRASTHGPAAFTTARASTLIAPPPSRSVDLGAPRRRRRLTRSAHDLGVGQDDGAGVRGGPERRDREPRRRGSGGRGRAPSPRRPSVTSGGTRRRAAAGRDAAVSAVGEAGQRAVEEDAGAHLPERRRRARPDRHDELQRLDEVGGDRAGVRPPLAVRLPHQADVAHRQIAQAAVHAAWTRRSTWPRPRRRGRRRPRARPRGRRTRPSPLRSRRRR